MFKMFFRSEKISLNGCINSKIIHPISMKREMVTEKEKGDKDYMPLFENNLAGGITLDFGVKLDTFVKCFRCYIVFLCV